MRQLGMEIVLGPGGLIRDDRKENEELLEQLEKAPALQVTQLLKLAEFYQAYSTTAPIGNHLALVALARLLSNKDIKENIHTVVNRTISADSRLPSLPDDLADIPEDIADFASDEKKRGEPKPLLGLTLQWVSDSGIGLLIETPVTNAGHKKRHYVIGVSPNPESL